jgi:hypothetical protein
MHACAQLYLQMPQRILAYGVGECPNKVDVEEVIEALLARLVSTVRLCEHDGVTAAAAAATGSTAYNTSRRQHLLHRLKRC